MKTFSIILTAAITAILFAAGCVNEEPAYKNEPGTTPAPEDGTGYLSMAGMTMRVIYDDQTDTQPDDTSSETVKPQTRAEEAQPDVDEFIVEIFDAEGTTVYKDTYANRRIPTARWSFRRAATNWRSVRRNPPRNSPSGTIRSISRHAILRSKKTRTPSSKRSSAR